ncbi:hypothetical protein Tco_0533177 [Tanacetum coccineum]
MSFKNFIYIEDDEDLTFLPKDFSPGFNTGSPSVSINTEPVRTDEEPAVEPATNPATEPMNKSVGTTVDSRGVPKEILLLFTLGVLGPALGRGSAKQGEDDTPVLSISNNDKGLEDCLELKDVTACHLNISAAHVMRARELAREEECEGLLAKCEAAMTDFNKNPAVLLFREKMSSLATEVKEHKGNLDRLMLESQKWLGYQEIEEVKHDRREVVSKVVPYACMELLHSDELGRLVGKLVSSTITFGRSRAYEQVARMKEPFNLSKGKGYRPLYEKEHTQARNDLATTTFSWLNEYVADASASMEALLSKKPPTLQKPVPLRTQIHVPSSQLATPFLKLMSPPADIVKPSPSPNE